MTYDDCQQYLEDPEAFAAHLKNCDLCSALATSLEEIPEGRRIAVDALPAAEWEGAQHRSWPLLIGGALLLLVGAAVLFAVSGTSPVAALSGRIPPADVLVSIVSLAGGAAQRAPLRWQVGIVIAFFVVNAVFIALLRRAPRGLDV